MRTTPQGIVPMTPQGIVPMTPEKGFMQKSNAKPANVEIKRAVLLASESIKEKSENIYNIYEI